MEVGVEEVSVAIKSFQDLQCYQNALHAIPPTEDVVKRFILPRDSRLATQVRNAAHSVPSNIAEGYGYKDKEKDFKRFLRIAMGFSNEVIARLDSARVSGYVEPKTCELLCAQWTVVGKQLNKLIQNWRTLPTPDSNKESSPASNL